MRRALYAVLALVLAFAGTGCGTFDNNTKKIILAANEFQDATRNAYNEAKDQTEAAGKACGTKARAQTPPVTPSLEACAALGVPIPYDPAKINKLAGPINAAYEAIRGADAARLLYKQNQTDKANVMAQISIALEALTRFAAAAKDLGLQIKSEILNDIQTRWEGLR